MVIIPSERAKKKRVRSPRIIQPTMHCCKMRERDLVMYEKKQQRKIVRRLDIPSSLNQRKNEEEEEEEEEEDYMLCM